MGRRICFCSCEIGKTHAAFESLRGIKHCLAPGLELGKSSWRLLFLLLSATCHSRGSEAWEWGIRAPGFVVSNQETGACFQSPLCPGTALPGCILLSKAPPQPGKAPCPAAFLVLGFWVYLSRFGSCINPSLPGEPRPLPFSSSIKGLASWQSPFGTAP